MTTKISTIFIAVLFVIACKSSKIANEDVFAFKNEQTEDCIAIYGSKTVSEQAYNRAYSDVKFVFDKMDNGIKQGMLNTNTKLLVVKNEDELERNISFFTKLLPLEAVFTDNEGFDETTTSINNAGLSTTKLELIYLSVYYSLLTESDLSNKYIELQQAYEQASKEGVFTSGEAYQDGYMDEIHQNASDHNALKYGSYMFGLYKLYFGNDLGMAGEFTIRTKEQLRIQNPLGYTFIRDNYDQ